MTISIHVEGEYVTIKGTNPSEFGVTANRGHAIVEITENRHHMKHALRNALALLEGDDK